MSSPPSRSRLTDAAGHVLRAIRTPAMPGPFVNTRLLSVGLDDEGCERFWCSTFNHTAGSTGVLVDERGRSRVVRFGPEHPGFYGAAVQDRKTLWLCGSASHIVRLSLDDLSYRVIPTGVPGYMIFAGLIHDRATARLFCCTTAKNDPMGMSFDLRTGKATLIHKRWKSGYQCNSFPNGDGTHTLVQIRPLRMLRWNPRTNRTRLSSVTLPDGAASKLNGYQFHQLLRHPTLGVYLPELGWYDAARDRLTGKGPRPSQEMTWFATHHDRAYGASIEGDGLRICTWDLQRNTIEHLTDLPDLGLQNVTISRAGNLVSMSLYGTLRIHDGTTGQLKLERVTRTTSIGSTSCLRLTADRQLVGTTFITQRFWMANPRTGKAHDCGRAAPKLGQIMHVRRLNQRLYFAAYTGGELLEFDPRKPAAYPVNPRVLAHHAEAMRPIAIATQGSVIWYASSRHYGINGSVLCRHDTRTGQTLWKVDTLGPRRIFSMLYHAPTHELIVGSGIHPDQRSADPQVSFCQLARLSADDFSPRLVRDLPPVPLHAIEVLGYLSSQKMLCRAWSEQWIPQVYDVNTLRLLETPLPEVMQHPADQPPVVLQPARKPGEFVIQVKDRLELHHLNKTPTLQRVLVQGVGNWIWFVDGKDLLITRGDRSWIAENAL